MGAYINRGAWEGDLLFVAASESYLSAGFQDSCIPNWCILSASTFEIPFHCLLAYIVSNEQSALFLCSPSCVHGKGVFSPLTSFKISLYLWFSAIWWCNFCVCVWIFSTWDSLSFSDLWVGIFHWIWECVMVWGRLGTIILLNISSVPFSLPSPSGTPLTHLSCSTGHWSSIYLSFSKKISVLQFGSFLLPGFKFADPLFYSV